jgi:hypothetical protein
MSNVAAVLERMQRDPRSWDYSRACLVVLATAVADGAPLRYPAELTVVLRTVHLIDVERMAVRPALARARSEPVTTPALRGIVRWASSRLASPAPLATLLAEYSADSLRQLEPRQLADVARRLLLVPPDVRVVDALWEALRTFDARIVEPEPAPVATEREHYGELLGACFVCGQPVGRDDALFAYWRERQRDWRQIHWAPGKPSKDEPLGFANVQRRVPDDAALLCGTHVVRCLRVRFDPLPEPGSEGT